MPLFADVSKRDISFLESEFLTYLLARFFISDNSVDIEENSYYFVPVKNIVLADASSGDKISIETDKFDTCKELYTALKSSRSVTLLQMEFKNENIKLEICLKTDPVRITKVKAPKSLAEEQMDKIVERKLYVGTVFAFFDKMVCDFVDLRINREWYDFVEKFRNFLKSV